MDNVVVGTVNHAIPIGYSPVYIGRSGKGLIGHYGNPFSAKSAKYPFKVATTEIAIKKFKEYINSKSRPAQYDELKLRYQNGEKLFLRCFCKKTIGDKRQCHGDIIKYWLEN